MKTYKTEENILYDVYFEQARSFQVLESFSYPSDYFVLLIIADFTEISDDVIAETAQKLIEKGMAYICTWGPDCERAHDAFDLGNILWQENTGSDFHVMSTFHDDESLEEALWYGLFLAAVDDSLWDKCSTVVISIENYISVDEIDYNLSNISILNEKVVTSD